MKTIITCDMKPFKLSGSQKRKGKAQQELKKKHELTKMRKLSDIWTGPASNPAFILQTGIKSGGVSFLH